MTGIHKGGISDQESNVNREGFIKYVLVDVYGMEPTWYFTGFKRPNLISDWN